MLMATDYGVINLMIPYCKPNQIVIPAKAGIQASKTMNVKFSGFPIESFGNVVLGLLMWTHSI